MYLGITDRFKSGKLFIYKKNLDLEDKFILVYSFLLLNPYTRNSHFINLTEIQCISKLDFGKVL